MAAGAEITQSTLLEVVTRNIKNIFNNIFIEMKTI